MGLLILFLGRVVIRWERWFEIICCNVEKFRIEMGKGADNDCCLWGAEWKDGGEKDMEEVVMGGKSETYMSGVIVVLE